MEAVLKKEIISNKTVCRMMGVLFFAVCMSLGAFVRIPLPFTPVPVTLQTFFVLLSGAFLGANLGAAVQLTYVAAGFLGLPVFTSVGSGVFYILGPTGGYLCGFVLASVFIGMAIRHTKGNLFLVFLTMAFADALLLFCGIAWLKVIFGLSFSELFAIGILPFIPGDLLKAFVAALVFVKAEPRIRQIF